MYQNESSNSNDEVNSTIVRDLPNVVEPDGVNTANMLSPRRRKYVSTFDSSVVPYNAGINKIISTLIGKQLSTPSNYQYVLNMNNIWMLNHALDVKDKKRWFSWHADRILDQNPIQKIGYLPNMNMSPTSDSVVLKTLEIAQNIAKECKQRNIIVTFDLAIACKAFKIQATMSPKFDNLFINMGAFHTEMAFFKVSVERNLISIEQKMLCHIIIFLFKY